VFIGNLKLLNWLYSYPEIAVDWHVNVNFKYWIGFFPGLTAILASTHLFYVRTLPGSLFLHFFNDVLLIYQN
jgi:hypothetical protein